MEGKAVTTKMSFKNKLLLKWRNTTHTMTFLGLPEPHNPLPIKFKMVKAGESWRLYQNDTIPPKRRKKQDLVTRLHTRCLTLTDSLTSAHLLIPIVSFTGT